MAAAVVMVAVVAIAVAVVMVAVKVPFNMSTHLSVCVNDMVGQTAWRDPTCDAFIQYLSSQAVERREVAGSLLIDHGMPVLDHFLNKPPLSQDLAPTGSSKEAGCPIHC